MPVGMFNPRMVNADALTAEQQERAAALLCAMQALAPDASATDRILTAQFIVAGAPGYVVLLRTMAQDEDEEDEGEEVELRDAAGRLLYSSREREPSVTDEEQQ